MKKILAMAAALAIGAQAASAQQLSIDSAIRNVALTLAAHIESGSTVAVVSMNSGSMAMSNYLINQMIHELVQLQSLRGFTVVDRARLDHALAEMHLGVTGLLDEQSAASIGAGLGARFIIAGAFNPHGGAYLFTAQVIEAATFGIPGSDQAQIINDAVVAGLLGPAGRTAQAAQAEQTGAPAPQAMRRNWISGELSIWGLGARYERRWNEHFALGGFLWGHQTPGELQTVFGGIGAAARLFAANIFFLEIGLGAGVAEWVHTRTYVNGVLVSEDTALDGGLVSTTVIGVRIGGQTQGFFVEPFFGIHAMIGEYFHTGIRFGIGAGWAW